MAADAADTALWGYLLYGGQVIDSTLVRQMEADPQDSDVGLYRLGTIVMADDLVLDGRPCRGRLRVGLHHGNARLDE